MMDRTLQHPPRLSMLYGSVLARSVGRRIQGLDVPHSLPKERHRMENVTASPAAVRQFQQLLGGPQLDRLPSGYIHTLAFPIAVSVLARPDFPLPLLGMIHLRNEVSHLRSVGLDERLTVTAWTENLRPHRSGMQVDVRTEVATAAGLVWSECSAYLAKGVSPANPVAAADSATVDAPSRNAPSSDLPADPPAYPTTVWSLAADIGRRYAAVSGDCNPIHLGVLPARAMGLRRPIAHGMYLASRMVAMAGPASDEPFRWTVDFRSAVTLPSRVFLASSVRRSAAGQWLGAGVTAWSPSRRRTHFTGFLERLELP